MLWTFIQYKESLVQENCNLARTVPTYIMSEKSVYAWNERPTFGPFSVLPEQRESKPAILGRNICLMKSLVWNAYIAQSKCNKGFLGCRIQLCNQNMQFRQIFQRISTKLHRKSAEFKQNCIRNLPNFNKIPKRPTGLESSSISQIFNYVLPQNFQSLQGLDV